MKRILDINSFLKEAEDLFLSAFSENENLKIKHKKNDEPLTEWFHSKIHESTLNVSTEKSVNLVSNKKLNKQEVYNIKKNALDFTCERVFNKKNNDYFSNSFIYKMTKENAPLDFPIELDSDSIIYLYLNIYPLALIKIPKHSSIIDPASGDNYKIEDYYQNVTLEKFVSPTEKGNLSVSFSLFFGYLVLQKNKE